MKNKIINTALALQAALLLASCAGSDAYECQPTQDLIITAKHTKDKTGRSQLEGSVFNNSLTQDYSEPKVRVDFYNTAGQNISAQEFVLDKKVRKGQAEEFSFDYMAPVGADSASWSVACARYPNQLGTVSKDGSDR